MKKRKKKNNNNNKQTTTKTKTNIEPTTTNRNRLSIPLFTGLRIHLPSNHVVGMHLGISSLFFWQVGGRVTCSFTTQNGKHLPF